MNKVTGLQTWVPRLAPAHADATGDAGGARVHGKAHRPQKTQDRRPPCGGPRAKGIACARAAPEPVTRVAVAAGRDLLA